MAGIHPDDPSLYPKALEDVFPFNTGTEHGSNGGSPARAE
jgi:hypothetical protein